MKRSKLKSVILLVLVCYITFGCVTLQQPLPGILWGSWAFEKTGFLNKHSNPELVDYQNICTRESDRLHFSSDGKMKLRWYDESCIINEYLIGRYHVEGNLLYVDLAKSPRFQDSPFPPITKYRIMQINDTTLELEEIPNGDRSGRDRAKRGFEPLVFDFMRID
ncbi:hypothetical protein Aeqsu_2101 [Aequorivita sublithincola DSM 14238]|uniref:Lipocalin-like domain-containing protein n=1 Tax=Aequorivita sublithincola (strain DSM 14238 / LMG 21431 / ACAM 643 / 9-3) TaxID=746697 RepID=I3YX46_AEQSU|nr:hypothetical protein [Aequorivita sublithincola]AFL81564.1 hypothetical protein Aeqsu_2101 [Aequorivita sublithincola DSM 14238]